MEGINNSKKRLREQEAESEVDMPEVKKIRDDLLSGFLDESETNPATLDLDSVMKSFQEEISASSSSPVQLVDLTSSESGDGDSQPELGYLLEASDDELGLPPSSTVSNEEVRNDDVSELARVASDASGVGEFWGFDDQIPNYDSFEIGLADFGNFEDYGAFDDRLFEYSDVYFDSTEVTDFSWRQETLPIE